MNGSPIKRPKLKPLSSKARISRLPLPPEELAGALQDKIHQEIRKSRLGKTLRSKKILSYYL